MDNQKIEKDIIEIRRIMEESTKVLSLSGFSGISVGIIALVSIYLAYYYIDIYLPETAYADVYKSSVNVFRSDAFFNVFLLAISTIVLSLSSAYYFTFKKNKITSRELFKSPNTKKFLFDLFIPLFFGGMMCLIASYHVIYLMIIPLTLVFYGLALVNASKFSTKEIRQLGIFECIIGLLSFFFLQYSEIFWAFGFGVLHIIYGILIYLRYER